MAQSLLQCPKCHETSDDITDKFCSTCGTRLIRINNGPQPTGAKKEAFRWQVHKNVWLGYTLEKPEGWEVRTLKGVTTVCQDEEGQVSATMIPLPLSTKTTAEALARQLVKMTRATTPSFKAWRIPLAEGEKASENRIMMRVQATQKVPLEGVLFIEVYEGAALIRGFQAPVPKLKEIAPTLEHILASVRPIEPLARTHFVETNEGACSGYVPQGWQVIARVRRGLDRTSLFEFKATDPTGMTTITMPPAFKQYQGNIVMAFNTLAQYRAIVPATRYIQDTFVPQIRRNHPDATIERIANHPDMAQVATAQETRSNVPGLDIVCDVASVQYTFSRNGTLYRARDIVQITQTRATGTWTVQVKAEMRAPATQFEEQEAILSGIMNSIEMNQQWQQREKQYAQGVLNQAQQRAINAQQAHLQSQQNLFNAQMGIAQDMVAGTNHRNDAFQQAMHGVGNAIRGTQDMYDPQSGRVFNVDLGYGTYWADAMNQVHRGDYLNGAPGLYMHKLEPLG